MGLGSIEWLIPLLVRRTLALALNLPQGVYRHGQRHPQLIVGGAGQRPAWIEAVIGIVSVLAGWLLANAVVIALEVSGRCLVKTIEYWLRPGRPARVRP